VEIPDQQILFNTGILFGPKIYASVKDDHFPLVDGESSLCRQPFRLHQMRLSEIVACVVVVSSAAWPSAALV
jgi:hypothetical protein